jgi:hypothetical protein
LLFATEIFESFNAIIRAWSIHSNRLAPSRDIAMHAAALARIRHLFAGGYFQAASDEEPNQPKWVTAGAAVLAMGQNPSVISQRLGINHSPKLEKGEGFPQGLRRFSLQVLQASQRYWKHVRTFNGQIQ